MAALVASSGDAVRDVDDKTNDATSRVSTQSTNLAPRPPPAPRLLDHDEVVNFLQEYFVPYEPILASLNITNRDEVSVLLGDLVKDSLQCPSSIGIRDQDGKLAAVCLASKPSLFDKQMDRLFRYTFPADSHLFAAVEFLKYVFNRVDVAFHCEDMQIQRPVFVALVSVRPDEMRKGHAKNLLEQSLSSSKEAGCDGALVLCSNTGARKLMTKFFKNPAIRIRYCDFRGEYREPPITPNGHDALHVMFTRL